MTRLAGLPPVVSSGTRLLILGSLPGAASLAAARYYAHPRNAFWALLGEALALPLEPLEYPARLAALAARGVGLWDVVGSARRRGSLDAALREVATNPLADLVATLPALRAVAFNGATAARIGRRVLAPRGGLRLIDLPSSSPAYAAMARADKARRWRVLADALAQDA